MQFKKNTELTEKKENTINYRLTENTRNECNKKIDINKGKKVWALCSLCVNSVWL